ncbi:MAG: HNH endonuclease signature motif containing protein [Thermaurantimonas sp.]|uniref:HNH endonuclease signature motif containing protein n=1 Tax=Thermaurantimonas sp. TaxID=2681568 RepID=UPI00391A611E
MLYQFDKLSKKLDEWGFPSLKSSSGFRIIKGIDFEKAYKAGSISFEDDGIYLEYEGKKYRGYMFIKEPYISTYGSYPKFHLTRCHIIRKFIEEGKFKERYEWSNSNVNDLIDKTTRKEYKDQVLVYCGYCKREIFDSIETTEDFFDKLDKSDIEKNNIEVDIFGYVRGKEKISKDYREKRNYTCESCGIAPKAAIHRRYWHTHHIDGDKTNNKESNLQCLCILCHCYKDPRHEENFNKNRMKIELKSFIKIYRDELIKIQNPFLKKYDYESQS